jgi:hypothetical protein
MEEEEKKMENKLLNKLNEEIATVRVSNMYNIGYNNGLQMAKAIALNTDSTSVVRCKKCKYRGDDWHCPMCYEEKIEWDDDGYTETDYILHDKTHDDGFCDRGECQSEDSSEDSF